MLLVDLPHDILEEIAQSLKKINEKSLQSLALASRALCHPTQRQIFRSISLTIDLHELTIPYSSNSLSPPPSFARLRDILTENPALATYVQDIQCFYFEALRLDVPPFPEPKSWMIDHGLLLAEILQLLGNAPIKSLSIVNIPRYGSILANWSSLHETLQQTLIHRIFNKETLYFVHFGGFSLPQNIFKTFVGLKGVCLDDVFWLPRDDDLFHAEEPSPDSDEQHSHHETQSTSSSPLQQLSSLRVTISDSRNTSLEILGPKMGLDLTGLQIVQLDLFIISSLAHIRRFLLSPTLKDLTVSFPHTSIDANVPSTGINLNTAFNLRNLTLRHGLFFLSLDEFSWIDPTLSSLRPQVPLQNLTITLAIDTNPSDITDFKPFTILSQTLSRFHRVFESRVERVVVDIELVNRLMKEEVEVFKNKMEECIIWDGCGDVLALRVAAVEEIIS
ncbi:hypothetical protein BDN72DRAFT_903499 [Pluteus cervinus]|uniref:Uncharacterized protein n=1 Tax=Pluteus cervinus TaxID=181527 RepID=A0ACD3A8V5_9AGAR|nr:hypothetical protein BDN72DRAFT_903499 [Pluteus cervinus]